MYSEYYNSQANKAVPADPKDKPYYTPLNGDEATAISLASNDPDVVKENKEKQLGAQSLSGNVDKLPVNTAVTENAQRLREEEKAKRQRSQAAKKAAKGALDRLEEMFTLLIAQLTSLIEAKEQEQNNLRADNKIIEDLLDDIRNGDFDPSDPETRAELEKLGIDIKDYIDADGNIDYDRLQDDLNDKHSCNVRRIDALQDEIDKLKEEKQKLQEEYKTGFDQKIDAYQLDTRLKELDAKHAMRSLELDLLRAQAGGLTAEEKADLVTKYEALKGNETASDIEDLKEQVDQLTEKLQDAGVVLTVAADDAVSAVRDNTTSVENRQIPLMGGFG